MDIPSDIPIPELDARRSRCWLLAVLLFVAIRAAPNISYPMGRDQATYGVIGQGLLNGQQLYRDLWDNKPPGIYALYALVVKAFGHVPWSAGLVDILWMIVIAACIFKFTERYLGTAEAVVAVVVHAAWHCRLGYVDAGQSECFLMVAIFLAYFLARSGRGWPLLRHFAAGLLLGGGFWLKYNAVLFFPLVAVVPYLDRSRLDLRPREIRWLVTWRVWERRMGALLAGFLLAVLAVLAYYRLAGSWPAFYEAQFKILPQYASMPAQRIPHYWAFAIASVFIRIGFWTVLATVAAVVVAEKRGLARLLPVLAGAFTGLVCSVSQLHFAPYAFETSFPFFAMIWGYLAVAAYALLKKALHAPSRKSRIWARVAASSLVLVTILYPVRTEARLTGDSYRDLAAWWHNPEAYYANYSGVQFASEHLAGEFAVIHYLKRSLGPGQKVYVWGTAPLIYFLTDRQPPTRFVSNHVLISPWGPPAWRQELVRDLNASRPTFIVVAQNDQVPEIALTPLDSEHFLTVYRELDSFISAHYRRLAGYPQFVLYRLKPESEIP